MFAITNPINNLMTMNDYFHDRLRFLKKLHKDILHEKNVKVKSINGIFNRYENPVLTAVHAPLEWRFDLDPHSNPFLLERFGINAVFNSGAIKFNDKYLLVARVEGADRKSFFAVAESDNGIDHFTFWNSPVVIPPSADPETNIYDMRLVQHQDGWTYGVFCTERRDPLAPESDQSSAIA